MMMARGEKASFVRIDMEVDFRLLPGNIVMI